MLEQSHRLPVGPVHVIEHHAHRHALRDLLEQPRDRREEQIALGLGGRGLGLGHVLHALAQSAHQAAELSAMTLAVARKQLLRGVRDELGADLYPRLIGHRELLRASTPAHGKALGVGAVGGVT